MSASSIDYGKVSYLMGARIDSNNILNISDTDIPQSLGLDDKLYLREIIKRNKINNMPVPVIVMQETNIDPLVGDIVVTRVEVKTCDFCSMRYASQCLTCCLFCGLGCSYGYLTEIKNNTNKDVVLYIQANWGVNSTQEDKIASGNTLKWDTAFFKINARTTQGEFVEVKLKTISLKQECGVFKCTDEVKSQGYNIHVSGTKYLF